MPHAAPRTFPISWSLFGAFGLVVVMTSAGFLLLARRIQLRVERAHSQQLLVKTQLQVESELLRLLEPIERATLEAQGWVERGQIRPHDDSALMNLLLPQMQQLPQCVSMMVSDMHGYEFLLMRNQGPGGLLDTERSEGAWITRDFRRDAWGLRSEWALWDERGQTLIREWERELDYDPRPRPWHAGPRELFERAGASELHWTAVDVFFTSKTPGITASVAARAPSGELLVIGYDLLFSDLSGLTQRLRPSEHGLAFVLTEDGRLVGAPNAAQLQTPEQLAAALLGDAEASPIPGLRATVQTWRRESPGVELMPTRVRVGGDAWWVALHPISIDARRRLWLGSALPERDLNTAQATWGGLSTVAGGILVSFLLTFWVARRFARPLRALVERSERLSTQDLTKPISNQRALALTEVHLLERSLETLRDSLASETEERDRAEEARLATEGKYRRLIENMPQSYFFYAHGPDGVFTYLSPSVTTVLGYSPEEFMTHYAAYMTDNVLNEEALRSTERSLRGERQPPYELELLHKDGGARRLEALEVPVTDASGAVLSVEGIARDVTQRRAVEAELQEAKEAAEAATEAKSRFLANMSHEIRTPLHAVLSLTRLLEDTSLGEEQRSYVTSILQSGEALLALVDDVLDFSRVEAGKLEFLRAPFELAAVLDSAFTLLSVPAAAKQLAFSYRVADDVPPWLVGDGGRLRQLLVNLLDNAIKFTPAGGQVTATLRALPSEQAGALILEGAVADTGIGIPPERLDGLFAMFEQADPNVHQAFGGTGLGLAICRSFCEGMGGSIQATSALGVGSTFTFRVRVEAATAPPEGGGERPPAEVRGARILVAEDNEVNRLVARRLLERLGCEVHTVNSGDRVLEQLERQGYDLVLMDLQMPGLDGLETSRRLRASGHAVPIVAMTANAQDSAREACRAAGMDGFLTKPVDPGLGGDLVAQHAGRSLTRP